MSTDKDNRSLTVRLVAAQQNFKPLVRNAEAGKGGVHLQVRHPGRRTRGRPAGAERRGVGAGDLPLDQFESVQKTLIARFDGDPAVHDLPRVMRLPGFYHHKHEPFLVRIIQ